jgi:diketogulonate reductase-like aldo/keto reductase
MISTISQFCSALVLSSGRLIPQIGLGVYLSEPGAETYNAIMNSFALGYRHVDTAQFYRNEEDVGRAIKDCGIPRDELFITTKLAIQNFGYDFSVAAIRTSFAKLQTTHIDLLLLHAPGDPEKRAETWRALEELQAEGIIRDIGVSNFGIPHIEKLLETAKVKPVVNQVIYCIQ